MTTTPTAVPAAAAVEDGDFELDITIVDCGGAGRLAARSGADDVR